LRDNGGTEPFDKVSPIQFTKDCLKELQEQVDRVGKETDAYTEKDSKKGVRGVEQHS
jgi:hypothetical protein